MNLREILLTSCALSMVCLSRAADNPQTADTSDTQVIRRILRSSDEARPRGGSAESTKMIRIEATAEHDSDSSDVATHEFQIKVKAPEGDRESIRKLVAARMDDLVQEIHRERREAKPRQEGARRETRRPGRPEVRRDEGRRNARPRGEGEGGREARRDEGSDHSGERHAPDRRNTRPNERNERDSQGRAGDGNQQDHLRQAIFHLRAAGLGDVAERVQQRGIGRNTAGGGPRRGIAGPPWLRNGLVSGLMSPDQIQKFRERLNPPHQQAESDGWREGIEEAVEGLHHHVEERAQHLEEIRNHVGHFEREVEEEVGRLRSELEEIHRHIEESMRHGRPAHDGQLHHDGDRGHRPLGHHPDHPRRDWHENEHGDRHENEHGDRHENEHGDRHENEHGDRHENEHGEEHGGDHGERHEHELSLDYTVEGLSTRLSGAMTVIRQWIGELDGSNQILQPAEITLNQQ